MGLTQTKLHFKILKENWAGALKRLETEQGMKEARTRNPLGDLPLHFCCYGGKAPTSVVRALLIAYPEGVQVRNKEGFLPIELARINYMRDGPYRSEVLDALGGSWLRMIASTAGGAAADGDGSAVPAVPDEVYRTSATCVICLDGVADRVVVPCGHLCLCVDCAPQVRLRGLCPVGRCLVGNIILAEGSNGCGSSSNGDCSEDNVIPHVAGLGVTVEAC